MLLVAYDVPCDKRRRRVAKALESLGRRVQKSVFTTTRPLEQVVRRLGRLIDPRADDIRIHPICATCEHKTLLLGLANRTHLPEGFRVI